MSPALRRGLHVVRAVVGIGLFAWVLSLHGGATQLGRPFETIWLLPLMAGGALVGAGFEALRLGLLFRSQGLALPFGAGVRLVTIGTFFNQFLPGGTGGDAVKLWTIVSENRGRGVETATVLLVDRAVALVTLLVLIGLLAALSVAHILEHTVLQWLAAGTVLGMLGIPVFGAVVVSSRLRATAPLRWLTTRAPLHRQLARVIGALHAFRGHTWSLVGAAAISFVGHLVLAAVLGTAAHMLVPEVFPMVSAYLGLTGLVANALPVTPGGLGVGEAAFDQLFGLAGATGGALVIVAWRLAALPVAGAGCVFYALGARGRRFTAERA